MCEERGSATFEFVLLAIPLLIPIAVGAISIMQVHEAQVRADFAVREAARIMRFAPNSSLARTRAEIVVDGSFEDSSGYTSRRLSIICSESPCLTPGGRVAIHLSLTVDLGVLSRRIESKTEFGVDPLMSPR